MRQRLLPQEHFRRGNAGQILDCRVCWRPPSALDFAFERGPPPITVDVDFEDRGVMDEAIDGGQGHSGIAEHHRLPLLLMG